MKFDLEKNKEFWLNRWINKEIGFHQENYNPFLNKYGGHYFKNSKKVFIPLCGKTKDILWFLERNIEVIGIEISEIACKEFFLENQIPYSTFKENEFILYQSNEKSITLIQGDFFSLTKEFIQKLKGEIDSIYDRASLIALPKKMRKIYVEHIDKLFYKIQIYFLITMEYELEEKIKKEYQNKEYGPPFSVLEKEIFELYSNFKIKIVEAKSIQKQNTVNAYEKLFVMEKQ